MKISANEENKIVPQVIAPAVKKGILPDPNAQNQEATSDQVMQRAGGDSGPVNTPRDVTTPQVGTDQSTDDLLRYPTSKPLPKSPNTPTPATSPFVTGIGSKDTYRSAYLVPGKANSSPDFGTPPADVKTHEIQQPQVLVSAGNQTQSTQNLKKRQRPADKITKGTQ